jgi:hypothetical protein
VSGPPKHALPLPEAAKAWDACGLFIEPLCRNGEWRCWARRGSRDGPWIELPIKAWELPPDYRPSAFQQPGELRIIDRDYVCRYKLSEERVPMRHPETGRKVFVTEERRVTTEKWYDPVFAPAAAPRTQFSASTLETEFKRWVTSLDHIPRLAECRAAFQDKPRDTIRALKRVHAPGPFGRPPKKVGG